MHEKNFTQTMTGITVGMLAGTAAYMMSGGHKERRAAAKASRKRKKTTAKAMKTAGTLIDSVADMMH